MRTALSPEVSVFNFFSPRVLGLAAFTFAATAAAQAPANDACAGAETLTFGANGRAISSIVKPLNAAAAAESTMSCSSSLKNTVWFTFTAPVTGSYTMQTCTGATVTNFDTILQAYSGACGAPVQVASSCNDDGCSPQSTSTVTLTAGTVYLVQVAAWSSATLTASSQVQLEVSYPAPPPANETCATAEVVVPNGVTPALSTIARTFAGTSAVEEPFACLATPTAANHSVWYSVTPTVTGTYRFETCSGVTPAVTVADTVLALYTGTCGVGTLTASASTCNNDSCGTRSALTADLTAGTTYYVQLAKNGATAPTATADRLQLAVSQIINGAADVCSGTSPSLNLNETILVTTQSDGGISPAQDNARLDGGACFTGLGQTTSSNAPGRDVAYQFRATSAGRYSFRLGTPTNAVDGLMYLSDSCVPVTGANQSFYGPPQCIAASNRTTSTEEQVSCVPLAANQTVFVWVDESTLSTAGSTVSLDVSPCNLEVEPNDTPATANALSCVMTGGTNPGTDVDFFALGSHPAGTRVYAMAEAAAANLTDFDMRVTTDTRTIEYDDVNTAPAFGGSAPLIAGAVLTTEPAYIRMNYFGSSGAIAEPYVLYSHVQRGAPTLETEPNNTMATASTSTTNYFSGSIADGGGEIDTYKVTANAGDLIFAALDQFPDRTDAGTATSWNLTLTLVDNTDTVVLAVDDTSTSSTVGPTTGNLTASTPTFPAEGLVYRVRTSGTYGLRVGKTSGTTDTPYNLSVSVGCADVSPTLTSVTPNAGSPSGNQVVTLAGTNFSSRSVVRFGTGYATVTSVTPTQLIVSTPAGSSGDVPVSVTNGLGLVATLSPGYTYDDPPGLPPILTAINPTVGPVTGGTIVTLTGSVFRRDAGVFFNVGGNAVGATSVTVNNATRITATTPAQVEGLADVQIVNFDGLSAQLDAGFAYQGPPSVSSVTPNTGLTTGGLTITLAGNNFRAGTTVRLGANLATAVTPAGNGLSLTAVTPSSTINGPVDVIVRTTDTQTATVTGGFTYAFPAPTLSAITPNSGFAIGGQTITLTGTGFLTGVTVTVGGVAPTNVTRVSATSITLTTPPGAAGLVDVVVTNTDTQSITSAGGFRYVAAPVLTAITPVHGPVQGGTRLTLTGSNFLPGAVVQLGGVPAFAVDVSSSTTITAVSNAGAAGVVDAKVINPDTQNSTLAAAFTYDGAPTLASLTPVSGSTAGGTTVTLTGSGFLAGASVVFGTTAATGVTVTSPTELTAVTPARPVGVVSVTVANTDNQSAELQRAFRFVAPPTLTAAAPTTGDVTGGTQVRLTGGGFSASTTVTFGGLAATQVSFVSDTEVDAVTPAHGPGAVDIVVSTNGASATLTGGFTYTRSAPTLTAAAPASGPIAGGTLLTLTGTGFAAGATVTVGGVAATDVVIVSNVLARVVTPAHAAGAVDVVFTNDDTQAATLAAAYTYTAPLPTGIGTLTDGGSGVVGTEPVGGGGQAGGVSCGCTSFDGSMLSLGGMGLLMVLSRRRRRS